MPTTTRKRTLINPYTKELLIPTNSTKNKYDLDYCDDFKHYDEDVNPLNLSLNMNDPDASHYNLISPTGMNEFEHDIEIEIEIEIENDACESTLNEYQWTSSIEPDTDDAHKPRRKKSASQSSKKSRLSDFTEEQIIATIHHTNLAKDAARKLGGASVSSLSKFLSHRDTDYRAVKNNPSFFFQRRSPLSENTKNIKLKKTNQSGI